METKNDIKYKCNYCNKIYIRKHAYNNHLVKCNLPFKISDLFKTKNLNKIISFMVKDKKNDSNKISLVLLKKIGSPIINQKFNKKILYLFLKEELNN